MVMGTVLLHMDHAAMLLQHRQHGMVAVDITRMIIMEILDIN